LRAKKMEDMRRQREAEAQAENERQQVWRREAEKAQQRQEEAKREEYRRRHDAWEQTDKHAVCEKDHYYPAHLGDLCPLPNCRRRRVKLVHSHSGLEMDAFISSVPPLTPPLVPSNATSQQIMALGTADSVFVQEMTNRIRIQDYIGLGNRILETLLLPSQEHEQDARARWLAENVRGIVSRKFQIFDELSFSQLYQDECLAAFYRGKWQYDGFPQLLIYAYVLGATWKKLPPPFEKLVPFYTLLAENQTKIIQQAAASNKAWWDSQSAEDLLNKQLAAVELQIYQVQHSNEHPDVIAEGVAQLTRKKEAILNQVVQSKGKKP